LPDIINRLDQHNTHYFKRAFTKAAKDLEIIISMEYSNKADANYLEKFIKQMKSKKFLQKNHQGQYYPFDIYSCQMKTRVFISFFFPLPSLKL